MSRGRILMLAGAAVCAAAAVPVALLARDAGRWPGAIRAGDVAAADPYRPGLASWSVDEALPYSPARHILGLGDDLEYRRSALLFRRAYRRNPDFESSPPGAALRVQAETALAHVIRTDANRQRRSAAANMLGILALVDVARSRTGDVPIDRSIFEFQDAVRLDRTNTAAKTNLELVYQQNSFSGSVRGRERLQRSAHAGASASAPGHGY
ncbi:MAG TPA: hypothetical protein VFB35_06275 [Gaiellaceae bacterium]|nr:hypothetical protein [Gaiellaceae bacterium]